MHPGRDGYNSPVLCDFVGYVVQGSNGEYVYQTAEERIKVVEHVVKAAAPGKVILAGSGCECELMIWCQEMISLPGINK